jgi:hypothetical protein
VKGTLEITVPFLLPSGKSLRYNNVTLAAASFQLTGLKTFQSFLFYNNATPTELIFLITFNNLIKRLIEFREFGNS